MKNVVADNAINTLMEKLNFIPVLVAGQKPVNGKTDDFFMGRVSNKVVHAGRLDTV